MIERTIGVFLPATSAYFDDEAMGQHPSSVNHGNESRRNQGQHFHSYGNVEESDFSETEWSEAERRSGKSPSKAAKITEFAPDVFPRGPHKMTAGRPGGRDSMSPDAPFRAIYYQPIKKLTFT